VEEEEGASTEILPAGEHASSQGPGTRTKGGSEAGPEPIVVTDDARQTSTHNLINYMYRNKDSMKLHEKETCCCFGQFAVRRESTTQEDMVEVEVNFV